VFWPMISELYGAATGRIVRSDAELIAQVRRWVIADWLRVVAILVAFVSSVRAMSIPFPAAQDSHQSQPTSESS